ncbi:hypothetical protein YC2023_108193 [Brassica napus]
MSCDLITEKASRLDGARHARKSAKWIRNFGKRIGSEGWARGSQFRTLQLLAGCLSCGRGESGPPRVGRGTDWERLFRDLSPGVEQPTQNWYGQGESDHSLRWVNPGGGHCQVGSLAGAAHLLKDELNENRNLVWNKRVKAHMILIFNQVLDCSPTNRERELGLDRRETD